MSGCVSGPAIYRHAFVGEAVFAYQGESPCKLTTDGLRSCIGFGGYDQDHKIGFLAHFYIGKHAEIFFANFEDILKSMAPQAEKFSFFCKRTGGLCFAIQSKSIVEIIRAFVTSTNSPDSKIHINMVEEAPLEKKPVLRSLCVNIAQARFSDYTPEENPYPRQKTTTETSRHESDSLIQDFVVHIHKLEGELETRTYTIQE